MNAVDTDAMMRGIVEGDENTITLRCLGPSTWLASRPIGVGTLAFHGRGAGPVAAIADLATKIATDRAACASEEDLAPALEASLDREAPVAIACCKAGP